MNKALEVGAFVVAGTLALAGMGAAVVSFVGDDEEVSPAVETAGTEFRSSRYGFSFNYPADWSQGPEIGKRYAAMVMRDATVMCTVGVKEQSIPSDAGGKPHNLGALLSRSDRREFYGARLPNSSISGFKKASLGGQEARRFTVELNPDGGRSMTVEAFATLRSYGLVVLMCIAPTKQLWSGEIRNAFLMVRNSFRFE